MDGGRKGRIVQNTGKNSWTATAKKAVLADGSERVLYRNPARPGELRLRRIRDGKATYVKPGKTVRVPGRMRGGTLPPDDSCTADVDKSKYSNPNGVHYKKETECGGLLSLTCHWVTDETGKKGKCVSRF